MPDPFAPLPAQTQQLLMDGPRHGIPTAVMEQTIQLLAQVAQDLDHPGYYLLRYPDGGWLLVETPPSGSWIPAFGHASDAAAIRQSLASPDLLIEAKGVIEMLFLTLGLQQGSGILVYDTLGDRQKGKTIAQQTLKQHFQQRLRQAPGSSHLA